MNKTTEPSASPVTSVAKPEKKTVKRQTQAKLHVMLAEKKCRHCSTVGKWKITSTQKRIRYIRCLGCGKNDMVVILNNSSR